MKKLIVLILAFICLCTNTFASPATPTDLEDYIEIDDDDFGYVNPLDRRVFLEWLKTPTYYDEEVTLVAILMDFLPTDIYTFVWEYSEDCEQWNIIENEHEQTYTFIINETNMHYYWRVRVVLEEKV